ncbi:GTPase IMAP family member 7-like [Mytilus edulis]|uniref:GTPase IMAP family member 7-like n=1 Tax=Mytilus edulis TaxID=6550 RepID=UPI0039F0B83B
MRDRVIIVFTHGDQLQKENVKLRDPLEKSPEPLKIFLEDCQNRYILFKNEFNKEESYQQISGLLTMIESLKRSNEIAFYSDDLFSKAEERIRVREREIEERLQQEYQRKQREYEQTLKIQLEDLMREEREAEIKKIKEDYEEKLENVREEVRKEISDKDSTW